ncbi:MAG TPA: Ku protein [Acetobacteraceae bacterium]|nr:Ku protein [Acetobacteraceae bacterium]
MVTHRPLWRGHLRLALVSCPIALYAARHEKGELHFNLINPQTGHRVRMVTTDAETGEEVERRELVRGYEFKKDTYVLMDDDDFERARIESSTVLAIDKFVPAESIDPIYYDTSYYVGPDGDAGLDVYVVLREAIRQSGRVALSRLVLARRERAVALTTMDDGLVLHTLHDAREIYPPEEVFAPSRDEKPAAEMVKLALQLIERQSGTFEAADMEDRYETRLREVIEAKLRGEEEIVAPEAPEERGNVVDLMTALKRSLGQATARPAPAKAATRTKAPAPSKPSGTSRAPARKAARKRA